MIAKLGKEPKYASQKDEYAAQFVPATASSIKSESEEILTKTIVIHFYPNSCDLMKKVEKTENGKTVQELYDPNVNFVIEEVAKTGGAVRRGAHHRGGPHRRLDEGEGAGDRRCRSFRSIAPTR